jgi:hypothetical protein
MSPKPAGPLEGISVEGLCDRYLAARPSPAAIQQMKKVEGDRTEVRSFVERVFRLMQMSRFRAADISPNIAWGGSIPPYTWEDRHKRIDAWLASYSSPSFGEGTVMLEMGCGFPPLTAVDASSSFPHWQVVGADLCFDDYLVYDERGHYACLDTGGAIRYFHAGSANVADIYTLYRDRPATLRRFSELFAKLLPQLPGSASSQSTSVSHEGARLVRWPLQHTSGPISSW